MVMKTLAKYLLPMAAITLASCTMELAPVEEPVANPGEIHITVKASPEAIQTDAQTKTYIDENKTILWGIGEYMKIGVTGSGEEADTVFGNSDSDSADAWKDSDQAYFGFSIAPKGDAPYVYQGLYPASAAVASDNTNPENYKVNLPSTQNATASSYDPAAYIMVAKPESFDAIQTEWTASYRRATALNKITIKNVPDGTSIKRVKITVPTGKYLAGARHINLATDVVDDVLGDIYNGGGRTETVEVKYATPLTGTNVDVWFTSWGVEVAEGEKLTIVAYTTDQKSFTKEITVPAGKSIKFLEGYLNTLGANLSGIAPETVTELEEGSYVVLAKDGENYYALKAEKEDGKERLLSVEYTGNTTSYSGDADIIWNLTKSGDSFIFENDGKYLGYKNSSNESFWLEPDENWGTDNYLLDVTAQETAGLYHVTVHSNTSRYLSKNSSSAFFAFYGNTGQKADIVFVPATVDTRTEVVLTFDESTISLTSSAGSYDQFIGQDVTSNPAETAITDNLIWNYEDSDGVISQFDGGLVELSGVIGTATVTVSFAGDSNYRPAEATYTIEVTDASEIKLTFPFTSAIEGWPNSSSSSASGSYTYNLSDTDYTFTHTKVGNGIYCQTSYLMIVSGNYLGLPAIEGYKLVSVSAQLNAGGSPSTAAKGVITSDTNGTIVSGGEEQTFDTKGGSKTFSLTSTEENTVYYLAISNKNFQCTEIALEYEAVAPDTRADAELSWSANSATASIEDGDEITFTAPTLNNDNGVSPVTYASTNQEVATVTAAGEVTVLAEGTTKIQAIFEGDSDYKPQTVEYTLTVADNRTVEGNDGSLEKPFTASEARALALGGDTGSYYISGIVTKIQNQYSASYGTANFWIDENGSATNVFEGYKIKYFGNINWVDGNAEIAVNDEVIIYGTLAVYNTTAETSSGYLVSLNGKTKGLTPGALTATPDNDNKQIAVTWGAATGTDSSISYVITCGTQTFNATAAGSHAFTMADYGTYSVSVEATASDAVSATLSTTATLSDPSSSTPTLQYTLDGTTTGGTNGYADASDITQSSVAWKVTGNTTMNPWRIGGKSLTKVDRTIYSTQPISSNISSIEVESGTANATVNSLTITVHSSAEDAASGSNAIATKSVTTGITSSTVILSKTDNTSWAGKYYRIVYNVTAGSSNQYVQFKSAKFYGTN